MFDRRCRGYEALGDEIRATWQLAFVYWTFQLILPSRSLVVTSTVAL